MTDCGCNCTYTPTLAKVNDVVLLLLCVQCICVHGRDLQQLQRGKTVKYPLGKFCDLVPIKHTKTIGGEGKRKESMVEEGGE